MNTSPAKCCDVKHGERAAKVVPFTDILEHDSEYRLYIEMPGVTGDSLTVHYEDGVLHIEGKTPDSKDVEYLRREVPRRTFQRSFSLGDGINAEGIGAQLKDGVLLVRLPKSDVVKPRKIDVRTS